MGIPVLFNAIYLIHVLGNLFRANNYVLLPLSSSCQFGFVVRLNKVSLRVRLAGFGAKYRLVIVMTVKRYVAENSLIRTKQPGDCAGRKEVLAKQGGFGLSYCAGRFWRHDRLWSMSLDCKKL